MQRYYEAESPEKLELVINKELKKLQTWLAVIDCL